MVGDWWFQHISESQRLGQRFIPTITETHGMLQYLVTMMTAHLACILMACSASTLPNAVEGDITQLFHTPDTLLYNVRFEGKMQCGGNVAHCRATSLSSDGGVTWTQLQVEPDLPDPQCKVRFYTSASRDIINRVGSLALHPIKPLRSVTTLPRQAGRILP